MNTKTLGPLRVETSQPINIGDTPYHAITNESGQEIARVHAGDDVDQAKKTALLMAAAPELHQALSGLLGSEFGSYEWVIARNRAIVAVGKLP